MHPLKVYLEENQETVEAFADRVCIEARNIQDMIDGLFVPSTNELRRIIEETDNSVMFNEFYQYCSDQETIEDVTSYGEKVTTDIIDFGEHSKNKSKPDNQDLIDNAVLAEILSLVFKHMREIDLSMVKKQDLAIAADAVHNTYNALARVTTRHGQSRLVQALEPVIEGILLDYSALLELSDRLPSLRDHLANQVSAQYLRYFDQVR